MRPPQKYAGNSGIRPDFLVDGTTVQLRHDSSWDNRKQLWKAGYFRMGDDVGPAIHGSLTDHFQFHASFIFALSRPC